VRQPCAAMVMTKQIRRTKYKMKNYPNVIREIENFEQFTAQNQNLKGKVVQGLDLQSCREVWWNFDVKDAVFLGCRLDDEIRAHLSSRGAIVFPSFEENHPYNPYRASLYTWQELMEGYTPEADNSTDLKIYTHFQEHKAKGIDILEALCQRIHDHAMDDALAELLEGKTPVGIMGGHTTRRDDEFYKKAAQTAFGLTRAGYFVMTGGGPGIMEAGNLGAYFATYTEAELEDAISILCKAPHYSDKGFNDCALEVLKKYPEGAESCAVPTWFYGHEPSNLFASAISKYFGNSIREDILLTTCTHGIVFAPGSGGTTQEIFQDACQNHYASTGCISPMVFLGVKRYAEDTNLYKLVEELSSDRPYHEMISLVNDAEEAIQFIKEHPPC